MQKQTLYWYRNGCSNKVEINCFWLNAYPVKKTDPNRHTPAFITESECLISDFDQWKSLIEESEDCSFSKMTGDKIISETGVTVKYLQCNRGGSNRKSGEGTRRGRMQGNSIFNENASLICNAE